MKFLKLGLLVGAVAACGPSPATPDAAVGVDAETAKKTLTVTAIGNATGEVLSTPAGISCGATCSSGFAVGSTVKLVAVPSAGAVFAGWSGACSGTAPTCDVTISSDTTATAKFDKPTHALTAIVTGNGQGSIASAPAGIACPGDCTETLDAGASVTLTGTANAGSTFLGWSGGGCTGTSPCTVTVAGATTVVGAFGRNQSLVVVKTGSGTGVVASTPASIDCGATCSIEAVPGATFSLGAMADAGSVFTGWSGACSGTGTCEVTLDTSRMVIANFTARVALTVQLAGSGTGAVTSNPAGITCGTDCDETYDSGTAVVLTAQPNAGSRFVGWTGGGCSGTGTCTVVMAAAATVTATFAATFDLTVTRTGAGTGLVTSTPAGIVCGTDCSEAYDSGTSVQLTATANAGSTFTGWSGGGCTSTGTCSVTMSAATTVTANFTPGFLLTVNKAGNGSGTVAATGINCGTDCGEIYPAGTVVTLTATPITGGFLGWSGGGCSGTGSCVTTVNTAVTVTATFDVRGKLFAIKDAGRVSQKIDISGAPVTTDLGVFGPVYAFGDCAFNTASDTMYAVDGRSVNQLFRVDTTTGVATLIGTHGQGDMFGLAYYPPTNTLYGVSAGKLFSINTTTGAATQIGTSLGIGGGSVDGLAFDSTRNRLVAITAGSVNAYSINVTTGVATLLVGGLPFIDNFGMTYDPVIDRFWVVDYDGNYTQLDPVTFARTVISTGQGAHTCTAYMR